MVERASEGINVAADVNVSRVPGLLGRDVVEGSECRSGDREFVNRFGILLPCQSEIDELRAPDRRDDDI